MTPFYAIKNDLEIMKFLFENFAKWPLTKIDTN